jgi:hypothetical protein
VAAAVALALATPARIEPRLYAESSCQTNGVERIVAIGDVHGAYDELVRILRVARLIDAENKWIGGKAHLVQLGDVVDRGPGSRKAIDLLRSLEKEAADAGGRVHVLLGNHEVMRILDDLRYTTPGEYQAFATPDSPGVRERFLQANGLTASEENLKATPLGSVEMRIAFLPQGPYGQWLHQLDVVTEINGIVFMHGGLSPAVAAMSCDDINATVRRDLAEDIAKTRAAPLESLTAREDGPLWYRGLAQVPDTAGEQIDDTLLRHHARAIVVGHTIATEGRIRVRFGGKVLQLDTGMQPAYATGGRASALEIRNDTFTALYEDRTDVVGSIPAEVKGP